MNQKGRWVNQEVINPATTTASPESLSFRSFERVLGRGISTINCDSHRRETIFGSLNWKFNFTGARKVLTKPRGGGRGSYYEKSACNRTLQRMYLCVSTIFWGYFLRTSKVPETSGSSWGNPRMVPAGGFKR